MSNNHSSEFAFEFLNRVHHQVQDQDHAVQQQHERLQHQQQVEEEEDCFYESLDHYSNHSSSAFSSSSEDEIEVEESLIDDQVLPIPKFPMSAVSTYEIWATEPDSVHERRKRLLREMGLSSDPLLSRGGGEYNRSNSGSLDPDRSDRRKSGCESITRSKSDGAVDCDSSDSASVDCGDGGGSRRFRGVMTSLGSSPSKPPTGRQHRRESDSIDVNQLNPNPSGECGSGGDCIAAEGSDQVCTIRNLDNGEEFVVVNETHEDGAWDKVREVGTGRQLTMEEFESCVGHSPIVQELMRRQSVEHFNGKHDEMEANGDGNVGGCKSKKKGGWLKSIKHVANSVTGHRERRSSDERDTSSEKGGRRSSSATDDSQDGSFHGPERVRVRQYGKSHKDLTALYKCQEIQAHSGSIWTIKFSLDGRYLASAGEDTVIHIWQVVESERKGDLLMEKPEDGNPNLYFALNGSPESALVLSNIDSHLEKKRRGRPSISRKSVSLEHIVVPETVFALSEKPVCSFQGHLNDVLDLSWSKSQYLLSSSMDKTVRLWHMGSNSCLKVFSHSDYVTCIQFNPVDDNYFISGSLDAKVRIWSIPDRQVVDWNDLHEMVTAACYTPDGQGALVGSYKGNCYLYNTSENKLHQKSHVNLQNKKKKSHLKKITGFQFSPGSSSEVLVTSADSRIRVIDGLELVHKFKGFRNTSSQISASMASNGKYVVCASGDSYVYVWNHEGDSRPNRSKAVTVTSSYEHFHCQDVSVALPWPGIGGGTEGMMDTYNGEFNGFGTLQDEVPGVQNSPLLVEEANGQVSSPSVNGTVSSPMNGILSKANSTYFFDRISATWPEEKLLQATRNRRSQSSFDFSNEIKRGRSAWGMVIVTAGLRGEIKTFQNYGLPVRL